MAKGPLPRIGIDLDNTLAQYDDVLTRVAAEADLLPAGFAGSKRAVRDYVRQLEGGELRWMELQAAIYGTRMSEAKLAKGADVFLARCRDLGVTIYVISHKTRYAARDMQQVDLHRSALAWMEMLDFFSPRGFGLCREDVFFEATRDAKCRRIAELGCTHFIDDLVEVFEDPAFPGGVARHLYMPESGPAPPGPFRVHRSWHEISNAILASAGSG